MRLAVIESAPRGGLLHYAAQLGEGLAERGHEVDLITARTHELAVPPPGVRIRAVLPVATRAPDESAGAVGLLVRRAGIAARVVAASARTLWELARGHYDGVILTDDFSVAPAAAGALALTLLPGRPRLTAVCHEPRPRSRRGSGVYERSQVLHWLLRRTYPRLDVVFVHGERSRDEFIAQWPRTELVVIPHGNERLLASEPPPPSTEDRILFFGEWRRAKGLEQLTQAFGLVRERRSEARLTIAGVPTPDSDPDRIRAWAAAQDGSVTLIDRYLEIDELSQLFAGARLLAAPYIAGSQSGVVHLAMTMGRAVVASDVGELPETVIDGETGIIVPAGDVEALAGALERLLADPELAERLGEAGRRRALEEYSWARVAERVEAALA
jgi:glycosyltransferase involved in cell wall biosynthesis